MEEGCRVGVLAQGLESILGRDSACKLEQKKGEGKDIGGRTVPFSSDNFGYVKVSMRHGVHRRGRNR